MADLKESNMVTAQTAEQTSFFESKMTGLPLKSRIQAGLSGQQSPEMSLRSNYQQIPSRNIKFEKFITEIFKSKMTAADVKDHIIKYV